MNRIGRQDGYRDRSGSEGLARYREPQNLTLCKHWVMGLEEMKGDEGTRAAPEARC